MEGEVSAATHCMFVTIHLLGMIILDTLVDLRALVDVASYNQTHLILGVICLNQHCLKILLQRLE